MNNHKKTIFFIITNILLIILLASCASINNSLIEKTNLNNPINSTQFRIPLNIQTFYQTSLKTSSIQEQDYSATALNIKSNLSTANLQITDLRTSSWKTLPGEITITLNYSDISEAINCKLRMRLENNNGLKGQNTSQVLPIKIKNNKTNDILDLTTTSQNVIIWSVPTSSISEVITFSIQVNFYNAIAQTYSATLLIDFIKEIDTAPYISKTYQQAPYYNPLKGFVPYEEEEGTNMSYSMEFFYLGLNEIMNGLNSFDWTALETKLNNIANNHNQAIVRIYLDYPGDINDPTNNPWKNGVPDFVRSSITYTNYSYDYYFGQSPDYNDQDLIDTMLNFISAFGAKYDGDPRIGFIQMGLIGFWGEWHTYPYNGVDQSPNLMASTATQTQIINAYDTSFNTTKILSRYPMANTNSKDFGYHDDMFSLNTLPTVDWHFLSLINTASEQNKWKTAPIGGEIAPNYQKTRFDASPPSALESYNDCVDQTHASWMLNNRVFWDTSYTGDKLQRAIEGATRLGYEFYITEYKISILSNNQIQLRTKLKNTGVAPFYYNWKVEIGILNSSNSLIKTIESDWIITDILPTETKTLIYTFDISDLTTGTYKLLLRIKNPLANGKTLNFANTDQNADLTGWLTLGPFIK